MANDMTIPEVLDALDAVKLPAPEPERITIPFDGFCYVCKSKIEAGTEALFVKGEGIRHIDCESKTDA